KLREWFSRGCRGAAGTGGAGTAGTAGGAPGAGGVAGAGATAVAAGGAARAAVVLLVLEVLVLLELLELLVQELLELLEALRGRGRTTFFIPRLLLPASPLPGPSPYSGPTRGLTECREPESRPVSPESRSESPVCTVRAGRVSRPRPPPVPGTHSMTLRPSTAPQRVPLPSPPASSFLVGQDPESDSLRAASPAVMCFLATAASALLIGLVDFAESASASVCPPSVGGECALGTDVLEDRHYWHRVKMWQGVARRLQRPYVRTAVPLHALTCHQL
ncbi:unnamed protein product, partial [Closterium sp. NIES-54]